MKKLIILSIVALAFISCGNNKSEQTNASNLTETPEQITNTENIVDTHNSQNSLDYAGIYEGTIPCADCSGIDIVITLDNQGNYTKKMTYQGKEPNNVFTTKGTYKWNDAGNKITLMAESDPDIYQVGENQLIMLDENGDKITGEFANMYVLKQTQKNN